MMRSLLPRFVLVLAPFVVLGCGQQAERAEPERAPVDGSAYVLDAAPEGAKGVIDARKSSKDGEEVVVVGRIGGDVNPWVKGRAAFSIVDAACKACSEIEGDSCPTPWDYCCEPDLPEKMALVKVVDEGGKLVKHDARDLLRVKELQTVTVRGKAERDDEGNLTIVSRGVYVGKTP